MSQGGAVVLAQGRVVRRALGAASLFGILIIIFFLFNAPLASACPNCAVGQQARSEVWNHDFGFNLFVSLLPFIVIGCICVRAEEIGRPARPGRTHA